MYTENIYIFNVDKLPILQWEDFTLEAHADCGFQCQWKFHFWNYE